MLLIKDELLAVDEQLSNINIENEEIKFFLWEFLYKGSKRIRTVLTSLYLKSLKSDVSKDSINIMAAGELIHNASLLHDDVLDEAELRRGMPTLAKKYSDKIAILAGNYLLSYATEKLMKINNQEILLMFLNCTREMCNAEIIQLFLRGRMPDLDVYISICEGKTAKLFEVIAKSCAIAEGLDTLSIQEFARNFGIFFQLKNDLEASSAQIDEKNKIFTPKDFLGIEKTMILMDNYYQKVKGNIDSLPDNDYKKGLEVLVSKL